MQLLLLRHGIATSGVPDASRALSPAGRERTQAVLQRLVGLDLLAGALYTSPLLRALQTAELAVAAGLAPALQLAPALAPGADALAWLLPQLAGAQVTGVTRLALVGHEPDLSGLAAQLIGAPPASLQLKKAGVILLGWPLAGSPAAGTATLQALLSPKLLLG